MNKKYNVAYEDGKGNTHLYCQDAMPLAVANKYRTKFINLYIDKPYPNSKGYYDYRNVRVIAYE